MIPDGYALVEKISSTDSAQVWHALDQFGNQVVVKLAADDERVARRFKREIDALRAAAGPHTMPVLAFDSSFSWYCMPVAARTLWDSRVPASVVDCLAVLEAVVAALRPIHATGLVHRDLKPQNILWLDDRVFARWVVADFGIVRNAPGLTSHQVTRANGLTGSEGWAAPEQYRDAHTATVTADVYAAGGILSWMLTGYRPSFGSVALPPEPRLRAVLKRATNSNPQGRYATLDELLTAVKTSTQTSNPSLELLVETHDWRRIGEYVSARPASLDRIIRVLPKVTRPDIRDWRQTDAGGLLSAVSEVAEEMARDYSDLPFGDIDAFLIWGVDVVRAFLEIQNYVAAEEVATALFGATARIHQFKPADAIIDWLNTLDRQSQQAMETAMYASDSFDFLSSHARGRWRMRGENDLVVRLRGDG